MTQNAIEVKNLSKKFKGFELSDISFNLPSGCIMGLVGENGAGKSTTIKLILGMLNKDGGSVKIFGNDNSQNLELIKQEVGVVTDVIGIPKCLTLKEIDMVMRGTFENWNSEKFYSLSEKFSLPEKKRFGTFSRGMEMKLGIAVALSHNAKLLILDEPTSGLDPVVRDEVVDMLIDFTRDENCSILISSHIISDLEKLCDYIAFLHKGKLILCEEKDVLLSRYGIVRCTVEQLKTIDESAIKYKKETPYGVEAMVCREKVGAGINISSISIEELFVFTVKGEK